MLLGGAVRPTTLRVDASTVCQLRCPSCPTGQGLNDAGSVGRGHLALEDFRRLLDGAPHVRHVELANWGEMFLNPELPGIVEHAAARGVTLTCETGANFNHASDEALEALAEHGFARLTVALDGASAETYRVYRRGGDFERVLANVRRLNAFKAKHASSRPALTWQFVVFGHNEHELPQARAMARELGMDFVARLSWDESFSPVRDEGFVQENTGHRASSREDFERKSGVPYRLKASCAQMWNKPQVNWDGRALGCCVNRWGDFGNVFESGVDAVLNGERMRYARRMLTGDAPARADIPCTSCHRYREMAKRGDFVGWRSVLPPRMLDPVRIRFPWAHRLATRLYPLLVRWF